MRADEGVTPGGRHVDVVVIGCGIGGLATALRLGRCGHRVRVLERDGADPPPRADDAFGAWARRGVPQWDLYHVFGARARKELAARTPDVIERLVAADAEDRDLSWVVADDPAPDDGDLRVLVVRRPVMEWALRTAVAATPGVELLAGTTATGLAIEGGRAVGVTAGGDLWSADVVVDAAGRRSPVRGWLRAAGVEVPPTQRSPCGIAYYSRYFRLRDGAELPPVHGPVLERGDLGYMGYGIAPGDARTYGVLLAAPAEDRDLRALRHPGAWDAAAAAIERVAGFVDPSVGAPIMPPAPMHGLENVLNPWVRDGRPLVSGLAAIGDAWAVTDPLFGWGASLALAHGFGIADALHAHQAGVDEAIVEFHDRHRDEIEQRFALACEDDRTLTARWTGRDDHRDDAAIEREALLFACTRVARRDVPTRRALVRRGFLLDLPAALWADERVVAQARDEVTRHPYDPSRHQPGPSRDQLLAAIAAAAGDGRRHPSTTRSA